MYYSAHIHRYSCIIHPYVFSPVCTKIHLPFYISKTLERVVVNSCAKLYIYIYKRMYARTHVSASPSCVCNQGLCTYVYPPTCAPASLLHYYASVRTYEYISMCVCAYIHVYAPIYVSVHYRFIDESDVQAYTQGQRHLQIHTYVYM